MYVYIYIYVYICIHIITTNMNQDITKTNHTSNNDETDDSPIHNSIEMVTTDATGPHAAAALEGGPHIYIYIYIYTHIHTYI